MNVQRRFENQITIIEETFKDIHPHFLKKKPVDRALSAYFRKNKKFGSKDRKNISAAIFGFYRWYGWLKDIGDGHEGLAYFLAYIMDRNPISEFIQYWGRRCGVDPSEVEALYQSTGSKIESNKRLFDYLVSEIKIRHLYPDYLEEISLPDLEWIQSRPNTWIRLSNPNGGEIFRYLREKEYVYSRHPGFLDAIELKTKINLNEVAGFKKGEFEVQDISSQQIGRICNPSAKSKWWDVCAGSGGKTLHLSDLLRNKGTVFATEVDKNRYKELLRRSSKNKKRKNIIPFYWDGKQIEFESHGLEGVLIDAPCSGSGTWRRAPDIRWHTSQEDIRTYGQIQSQILRTVYETIPKGCLIIYATCSMLPEENEKVIERFLDEYEDMERQIIIDPLSNRPVTGGIYVKPPEYDGNIMFVDKLIKR